MTKKKPADVEIFTDAGVSASGVAAWAAVIIRKDRRGGIVEASGLLRTTGFETETAEARAIANGLHKARAERLILPGERVVARCDNIGVVRRFAGAHFKRRIRPELEDAFAVIRRLATELEARVDIRHVKGHSKVSSGDFHAIMNARADFLCCKANGSKRKGDAGVNDHNFATLALTRIGVVVGGRPADSRLAELRATVARLTGTA